MGRSAGVQRHCQHSLLLDLGQGSALAEALEGRELFPAGSRDGSSSLFPGRGLPSPAPLRALVFHTRARESQVTPKKPGEQPLWARSAKGERQEGQVSFSRCWLSFPCSFPSAVHAHLTRCSLTLVLLLPHVGVGAASLLLWDRQPWALAQPSLGSSSSSIIIGIV